MSKDLAQLTPKNLASVRKARALLKEKASELLERYITTLALAAGAGEFEASLKGYQWLLEHVPDEDGERMVMVSIDKQAQAEGPKGPLIQIGFQLGGVTSPTKELPVITVEPTEETPNT